jgi:Flp pilus assembly protein TadD
VNVYPFIFSFVADHFQYMARLGVIVPVAAGLTMVAARVPDRFKWAPGAAAIAVLGIFGSLSWQHSAIFKDADVHYIAILERNPECWMAHNNLGSDLLDVGRIDEAKEHIDEALRLKPDLAVAHYNRGRILAMSPEHFNEAIAEFRNAIRLKPDMAGAHDNLGMALGIAGRIDEAIEEHRTAVRLGPEFPRFRNNLGTQLAIAGRIAEAIPEFQAAIQLEPAHAEAHNNLGLALAKTGRMEEAVSEFQTALQLRPDYPQARQNLEAALAHPGRR